MSNQQEGGSKIDDGNVGSPQSRNVASLDHLYGLEEEQRQQKQHDFYGSTMHKKKKATTSPRRCGSVHEQNKDEDSAAPNELDRKLPAAATGKITFHVCLEEKARGGQRPAALTMC